ncbi:protein STRICTOSIDINE SYNTHASE-LIKE 2 [Vigna radiata var. radiata]|uniref:Protein STRICTOSIDINE SYNTHASE-LIKE 2 n=1 Tax=Vigna radiata var. radiata TaxID=3916 RepID=A0A1S3T7J1_VIGRR|nr:protein STRICTOSIDINE SYNTHASE-LIKE 2 [Vigna radiata var. radiata]
MRLQPHFAVAVAAFVATAWVVHMSSDVRKSGEDVEGMQDWQYEGVSIDGGVGPESFAFDPRGEGPYTGISDGRIIKWQRSENRWLNFSVTSLKRNEGCGGAYEEHAKKEHVCGRPLGLCFSMVSNELYIADAYNGLVVVGPNGGTPSRFISTLDVQEEEEEESQPLAFTNGLDVDQRTGAVYFTTSSSKYQRRNYISLILSRDKSGKLMKYEPESEQLTILLKNLSFANGVALSKDGDYILIIETTTCRVLRYWLETPKAGTLEVFAELPGFPDNIKRSPRGGFWVGIYSPRERFIQWILSYPWIGKVLLSLPLDITKAYSYLAKLKRSSGMAIRLSEDGDILQVVEDKKWNKGRSISEVEERDGILWVGSIDAPFVSKYNINVPKQQVKGI